jgi:regulator of RNase E activity RraB
MEYPNDSDGDALRGVLKDGSDMGKPMFIDFHVAVPTIEATEKLAAVARRLGYHVKTYDSAECKLPWTCQCSTRMLATYEGVLAIQAELARLSVQFGGFPDGWGTF